MADVIELSKFRAQVKTPRGPVATATRARRALKRLAFLTVEQEGWLRDAFHPQRLASPHSLIETAGGTTECVTLAELADWGRWIAEAGTELARSARDLSAMLEREPQEERRG